MINSLVVKLTQGVHRRLRAERSLMAVRIMQPSSSMSLLDVGGYPAEASEFDSVRRPFGRVVVANIDPECRTQPLAHNMTADVADGCELPYADQSFDWVFSNAVLEHVGDRRKQEQFTSEIRRVARIGYFISTPNRHFFLDPHTYLPFYHLLSERMQRVAIHFSIGHMRSWETLRLLSAKELQEMLPSAHIKSVGPFGLNLVAYGCQSMKQRENMLVGAAHERMG